MLLRTSLLLILALSLASPLYGQTIEYVRPPVPNAAGSFAGDEYAPQPRDQVTECATPGNILLIIVDDIGVDNVGCYGVSSNPPPTPNIDTLARTGVLFSQAWSSPTCSATRAGIHTGRYSFRTGVGYVAMPFGENEILSFDEVIIPEIIGRGDYACGLIGKWHLGNRTTGGKSAPLQHGWDYHAGTMWHTVALNITPRRNYYNWQRTVNGDTQICRTYATTQTTNDAINWIDAQGTRPWFCYLSYNGAHKPFHAPPDNLHSYDLRGLDPDDDPLPHFLATVEALDTEIGRLLCSIADQLDHTTVIFIGDNGTPEECILPPCTPEQAKFTPYQGGIHVPMIISGAGVAHPGSRCDALVSTVDLFTTIVELAGHDPFERVPANRPLDSVSLVPYMSNPELPSLRPTVYSDTFRGTDINDGTCAIRNERYKLICEGGCGGMRELYDLWEDPYETRNLLRGRLTPDQQEAFGTLLADCIGLRSGSIAYAQGTWPYMTDLTPPQPATEPSTEPAQEESTPHRASRHPR